MGSGGIQEEARRRRNGNDKTAKEQGNSNFNRDNFKSGPAAPGAAPFGLKLTV